MDSSLIVFPFIHAFLGEDKEIVGVSHKQDDGTTIILPLPSTSSAGHPDTHGKTTRHDAAIRSRCLSLLQELFVFAF